MAAPPGIMVLQAPMFTNTPLSQDLKGALLDSLWPLSGTPLPQQDPNYFEAYFTYFQQECNPAAQNYHAIQSFEDFVAILQLVRGNPTASLTDIRSLIARVNPTLCLDQTKLSTSIELVIRLWLLMSVKITMPAHGHLLEVSLPWPDNRSLVDVLQGHLSQSSVSMFSLSESFPDYLNVVNVMKIANFRILWTGNLGEHLAAKDSCLYVSSHVSALKRLRESVACNAFLSPALIDETLATIDLLVPLEDARCNAWLRREINKFGLDDQLVYRLAANRSKSRFVFWQERLLYFSYVFDQARPSGPIQWWHDRRDMGRWWNYWLVVAGLVLTVLFGLVQSITGILQVIGVGGKS